MRSTLLLALLALFCMAAFAQQPTIEGDLLLCPQSTGTASIITDQVYDTYQWQWRFNGSNAAWQDAANATQSSFTYDHYNYSVTDIRVRVTLAGQTYFSNQLAIDGYAFLPIFTIQDFDPGEVTVDPNDGTLLLCNGASIEFSVGMPYTSNIQWFKDEVAIQGETNPTLIVTSPGNYRVSASPQVCPNYQRNSLPVAVGTDPDCNLSVDAPVESGFFRFYPNPVTNSLHFESSTAVSGIEFFDMSGKTLVATIPMALSGNCDTSMLATGIYVMKVSTTTGQKSLKLIKN